MTLVNKSFDNKNSNKKSSKKRKHGIATNFAETLESSDKPWFEEVIF